MQAGIVSASMVIVVSVTGISSFIIPQYNLGLSIRVLRFSFMILAGAFGLYGVFMGILIMLIHMAKLESFGVPYLSPLAPLDSKSLKDVFFRAPWWLMKKRPSFIAKKDVSRISEGGNKKNED
ncbi:Spore germination protein B1 [compost metagenome]